MAWLTGWTYRKLITLSRPSGAVTLYQMKLLVGESAGATGEDVDCNSHVQTDFDDLRFTAADGTTLLDYWIESITGTTPNQLATVWIEFNSIGTGATTFYMYYGNSISPVYSNGKLTFLFFDHFDPVTWATKTAMTTPRFAGHFEPLYYGNKIYCIGGRPNAIEWSDKNEAYDVAGNTWETKKPMPVTAAGMGACILNGKFHLIGGGSGGGYSNKHYQYDPVANTWAEKASIHRAAEGYYVGAMNGKIYIAGGCDGDVHDETYEYDPGGDSWTRKSDIPATCPHGNSPTAVVNNKMYVFGGGVIGAEITNKVFEYNPSTDQWTEKTSMPTTRYKQTAVVRDNKIYVIGGMHSPSGVRFKKVEIYDPSIDAWDTTTPDMTVARDYLFGGLDDNGKIYAIGGWDGTTIYGTNERYFEPSTTIDATLWVHSGAVLSGSIVTIDGTDYFQSLGTFTYKACRTKAKVSSVTNVALFGFQENVIGSLDITAFNPRSATVAWVFSENEASYQYTAISLFYDAFKIFDILWKAGESKYYIDGDLKATHTTQNPDEPIKVAYKTWAPVIEIDWVLVRNYASPEPTWGSWGSEEEAEPPPSGTSFVAWIN